MATPATPQRSLFVTNLAWFLMAIGALSVLAGLAQIVMTVVMDAVPFLKEAQDKQFESLGNWFFYGFYALHVVVSALVGAAGWGLHRRRNWARNLVLVLAWIGIAIAGVLVVLALGVLVVALLAASSKDALVIVGIGAAVGIPIALVCSCVVALLWWIAKRLNAVGVRREFDLA